MNRIVCKESRERITGWNTLDEVRHWAAVNLFPMREENGVIIVEVSEMDGEIMGRVHSTCEFRVEAFEDLGNGVLRSGGPR